MHYLHPRSRMTGTLFTTTLAISFAVVAMPHLLPCPVDRRQFADSYETPDGRIMRRRRKPIDDNAIDDEATTEQLAEDTDGGKTKRECPVPKPSRLVGQIMGFKNAERPAPPEVIVQSLDKRPLRHPRKEVDDTP